MALLLACGRIFINAWLNVLQKRVLQNRLAAVPLVAATFGLLAVLTSPFFYFYSFTDLPCAFWRNMLFVVALDIPGNFFLVKSVGLSDLSLIGPLNSYKPVVALLLGVIVLGELPSGQGLLGVAIILLGSLLLAPKRGSDSTALSIFFARNDTPLYPPSRGDSHPNSFYMEESQRYSPLEGGQGGVCGAQSSSQQTIQPKSLWKDRGAWYRLLALVFTAAASIFLKAAINVSSAMHTFLAWAVLGACAAAAVFLLSQHARKQNNPQAARAHFSALLLMAALFLAMQLLTLQIFAMMNVAYVLALFQLSGLLNVLLGWKLFNEGNILRRALASVIMIAGAVLLIIK